MWGDMVDVMTSELGMDVNGCGCRIKACCFDERGVSRKNGGGDRRSQLTQFVRIEWP